MRPHMRRLPTPFVLVLLAATPLTGQSVADVVDQMYAVYERHAEGVDNYTLVQTAMGFESTSYFEKEIVDGRPIFRMTQSSTQGFNMSLGDQDVGYGDIFMFGPDLAVHGRYAGRDEIAGHEVHVLAMDDLSMLDIARLSGSDDMDFVPKSARIYVDVEMMVPRRMEFDGEAATGSGTHEVTSVVDMEDYREVDGLLLPYRTVIRMDGIEAMIDPEMQAQMEEMRKQLENMPEDQRAMMERMMAGQMERMMEMIGGGGEPMTMEVIVTEVRVNAGPPSR